MDIGTLLEELGYAGIALLMFGETLFPPIPSEAILPLAGYLVERGELGFAGVLAAGTLGAMTGAVVLYELARRGGQPFALRFLKLARMDEERLAQAERWFVRRGALVVFAGRCVPGVRSLIALPAGVLKMPRGLYLLASLLGTLLWNSLLIGVGYVLGAEWERAAEAIGSVSKPLLFVLFAAVGVWLLRRRLRKR